MKLLYLTVWFLQHGGISANNCVEVLFIYSRADPFLLAILAFLFWLGHVEEHGLTLDSLLTTLLLQFCWLD